MKTNIRGLVIFAVLVSVQASTAEDALPKLAAANNTFAFKLLKELAAENQSANIFVSPYSAATALQMAANGAAGQTKTEMQQVLETSALSPTDLNAACKAAADLLDSNNTNTAAADMLRMLEKSTSPPAELDAMRKRVADLIKETSVILTTANALWYREGSAVKPGFLEANQNYFSSTIKPLDFTKVPAAEAEINQWASDQTHGHITGIANGMIDPAYTDLILAKVIYFKGKWADPFEERFTKERPFHPLKGATKNLPMMEMSKKFTYRKGSGYQAVRLPYRGADLAMYVFLPDAGSAPAKLLQIMNGDNWRRVTMPGFSENDGHLVLPKFKLETTIELTPALKNLGMKTAFNDKKSQPDADFSNMFGDPHHISKVRQMAFAEVNEEGTEAGAATVFGVYSLGLETNPPKPFEMIVDRPFLFAIVDGRSEMILFLGVVNDL